MIGAGRDGPAPPHPATTARRSRRSRLVAAGVVAAGAVGLLYAAAVDPRHGFYPPCVFHAATGAWCPGCGGARALHALLTGQVATALHDNALLVLLGPVVLVIGAAWIRATTARPARPVRIPARAVWALAIVIVTFTILRNIPVAPFSLLAPT